MTWFTYDSHIAVQRRNLPHAKDFAYRDRNIAYEENLHFPATEVRPETTQTESTREDINHAYLRPTAARFFSDRNRRYAVTPIAAPHSNIDPRHHEDLTENWLREKRAEPKFPSTLLSLN